MLWCCDFSFKIMIILQMNKIYFLLKILPFQYKEEFSSTAEIVQTIQTMTANLVKVMIINNIIFFMNTRFYRLMIQHVSFKFLCLSFYCLTLFRTFILTQSYIFFLCVHRPRRLTMPGVKKLKNREKMDLVQRMLKRFVNP